MEMPFSATERCCGHHPIGISQEAERTQQEVLISSVTLKKNSSFKGLERRLSRPRVLTALAKHPSSDPTSHFGWLITSYNYSSRVS